MVYCRKDLTILKVCIQHSQEDDRFYPAVYADVGLPTDLPVRGWTQQALDARGHDTLEQAVPGFIALCEFFGVPTDLDVVIVTKPGEDVLYEMLETVV